MADDLDELFPNLAPILRKMEGGATAQPFVDPLRANPDHNGVTTEDIQAYFSNRLSPNRQMFRAGVGGPPPPAGQWDAPGGNNGATNEPIPGTFAQQEPAQEGEHEQTDTSLDTGDRQVPSTPPDPSNNPQQTPQPGPGEMPQSTQTGDGDPSHQTPPAPNQVPDTQQQAPSDYVLLGDQRIPRARVEAYLAFDQRLQSDPELAKLLSDYVQGGGQPPSQQQAPAQPDPLSTLPEEYRDDPAILAVVQLMQQQMVPLTEQVQRLQAITQQQYDDLAVRNQRDLTAAVDRSIAQFQAAKKLTGEEVTELRKIAADMNVADGLFNKYQDAHVATEKALELAYYSTEKFRQREFQVSQQAQQQATRRKQNLNALGGTSGSSPRTTPAPVSAEARRQAMLAEVGSMFQGSWTGDNNEGNNN